MASVNKVLLLGNLTRDPELRVLPKGTSVCSFSLAMNRRFRDEAGGEREEVTYVDVGAWAAAMVQRWLAAGGRNWRRVVLHSASLVFLLSAGCVASSELGAKFTPPPRFEGFASRVEALQAAWAHAGRLGLNAHTVQIINGKTGSMRPHYTADHYVVLRLSSDLLAARGHYVVRKLPLSMGGGRAAHAAGVLTGSGLVTYGTANPRNDPFCRAEDLVGVVVATYHWAPRKGRP